MIRQSRETEIPPGRLRRIAQIKCAVCAVCHRRQEARCGRGSSSERILRGMGWGVKGGAWTCPTCRGLSGPIPLEASNETTILRLAGD